MKLSKPKKEIEFLKTLLKSFLPKYYKEFSTQSYKNAISYLVSLISILCIVMYGFLITNILTQNYIDKELSKFNKLEINIDAETREPVIIPKNSPQLIIDTSENLSQHKYGKILITNKELYIKFWKSNSYELKEFKNLLNKKDSIKNLILWLIVLISPSLLIIAFFLFLIKYTLLLILITIITFIITRLALYDIKFNQIFKIGCYALTTTVLLEILTIPFKIHKYLIIINIFLFNLAIIPLLISLLLFIIAIILVRKKQTKLK